MKMETVTLDPKKFREMMAVSPQAIDPATPALLLRGQGDQFEPFSYVKHKHINGLALRRILAQAAPAYRANLLRELFNHPFLPQLFHQMIGAGVELTSEEAKTLLELSRANNSPLTAEHCLHWGLRHPKKHWQLLEQATYHPHFQCHLYSKQLKGAVKKFRTSRYDLRGIVSCYNRLLTLGLPPLVLSDLNEAFTTQRIGYFDYLNIIMDSFQVCDAIGAVENQTMMESFKIIDSCASDDILNSAEVVSLLTKRYHLHARNFVFSHPGLSEIHAASL